MNKESQEAIKKVFVSFDKDKSGFIDIKEIKAIAKELGQEISDEELKKTFKELDINKDGKISFKEFWDWWAYGRGEKLERLVFLKLKAMNLIKKAHGDFVRLGASLESKYDKKLDHHYLAINMGESPNQAAISGKLLIGTDDINSSFSELSKGIDGLPEDFLGLIFRFKAVDESSLDNLKKAVEELKENEKSPEELKILYSSIKFFYGQNQGFTILAIHLENEFFQDFLVQQYQENVLDYLGENFNCRLNFEGGMRNSIQKLMEDVEELFVKHILTGFIFEVTLATNHDLMKDVRKALLAKAKEKKDQAAGSKPEPDKISNNTLLMSILHGSKVHIVFKDMLDVENLLDSLGLRPILKDQPSTRELLDELKTDWKLGESLNKLPFLDFLLKDVDASSATLALKIPKTLLTINLSLLGLGGLIQYLIK